MDSRGSLGPYALLRRISHGAMGEVWEAAKDDAPEGRVAVKIIPEFLAHDRGLVERLQREAEAAGRLDHPGIVRTLGAGEADGRGYIVMELLQGETLAERLARESPLPLEDLVRIAGELAEALAYVHAQGIVHRDLKPANIFLTKEGRTKLIDLGVAKILDEASLTVTGAHFGTPAYMAPESFVDSKSVTAAADVWSLGVLLYEAATGQLPFAGKTAATIIAKISDTNVTPQSPAHLRPDLPPHLAGAIGRCLERDPARRATSEDLAEAITGARPNFPKEDGRAGVPAAGPWIRTSALALLWTIFALVAIGRNGDDPVGAEGLFGSIFIGHLIGVPLAALAFAKARAQSEAFRRAWERAAPARLRRVRWTQVLALLLLLIPLHVAGLGGVDLVLFGGALAAIFASWIYRRDGGAMALAAFGALAPATTLSVFLLPAFIELLPDWALLLPVWVLCVALLDALLGLAPRRSLGACTAAALEAIAGGLALPIAGVVAGGVALLYIDKPVPNLWAGLLGIAIAAGFLVVFSLGLLLAAYILRREEGDPRPAPVFARAFGWAIAWGAIVYWIGAFTAAVPATFWNRLLAPRAAAAPKSGGVPVSLRIVGEEFTRTSTGIRIQAGRGRFVYGDRRYDILVRPAGGGESLVLEIRDGADAEPAFRSLRAPDGGIGRPAGEHAVYFWGNWSPGSGEGPLELVSNKRSIETEPLVSNLMFRPKYHWAGTGRSAEREYTVRVFDYRLDGRPGSGDRWVLHPSSSLTRLDRDLALPDRGGFAGLRIESPRLARLEIRPRPGDRPVEGRATLRPGADSPPTRWTAEIALGDETTREITIRDANGDHRADREDEWNLRPTGARAPDAFRPAGDTFVAGGRVLSITPGRVSVSYEHAPARGLRSEPRARP